VYVIIITTSIYIRALRLRHVHESLPDDVAATVACSRPIICSRLDYCNSLFDCQLRQAATFPEHIRPSLASLRRAMHDHITPTLILWSCWL